MIRATYTIDTKEFEKLMRQAPDVVRQELGDAIKKATLSVLRTATKEAPRHTGRLANSMDATIRTDEGLVRPTVNYAEKLHEGERDPTAEWENIKRWARRKGLSDRHAYFTYRKIRREGPEANPFMDRTFKKEKGGLVKFFERARDNIVKRLNK